MFTAQIILLAATAVAPLASNAAPILSGIFSQSKRADSNVQLAQGTNFFFSTLHLEDQCTPGQVACVSGNFATCSPEANWEITPCGANTSCFAVPNADNTNIDVKCLAESAADAAISQAGGQGGASVDFQVTQAPFPDPNQPTPTGSDTATATATDAATSTDSATPTGTDSAADPTETCIPDDGSDDGSNDGSQDASGSDANVTETATETASDNLPTATDAPTDSCSADEPEATETITLILVPNPTESGVYETETFTGGFPDATGSIGAGLGPGAQITDIPTGTDATPTATDAATGTDAAPTESCTDSATDGSNDGGNGGDAGYTDAPTDAAPTDSATADLTTSRTTFTAPGPSPTGINVVGTHTIPANPTKRSVGPLRFAKIRRT